MNELNVKAVHGFLRAATVIAQCARCYSLLAPERRECPNCEIIGIRSTAVNWLAFNDVSDDSTPLSERLYSHQSYEGMA